MSTDPMSSSPPLRRSPRLAKKRVMGWRELKTSLGNVQAKGAADVESRSSANRSDSKLSREKSAETAKFKCTPKRSKVDPEVAVSPWGLPNDCKAKAESANATASVDPKLALSPPTTATVLKSTKNRKATPHKSKASSNNKARVQFTSDTVYIQTKSLRKNVPRIRRTPTHNMATRKRPSFPVETTKNEETAFSFRSDNIAHSSHKEAPATPNVFSFGTTNNSTLAPSFSFAAFQKVEEEEKCFEELRLEHYLKMKEDMCRNKEEEKTKNIENALQLKLANPIKWSPIRSSRHLKTKSIDYGVDSDKENITNTKVDKESVDLKYETRVKFASDVMFNARKGTPMKGRKNTPHKRDSMLIKNSSLSPVRAGKISYLQTGAVRVNVLYHTNPRKRSNGGKGLIHSGAVRKTVTRHTTPRKLHGRRNMW